MANFGEYLPALEVASHSPLFARLAQAIATDIRRGRLPSRTRLPGSRELAQRLGLHRNTILAAYRELEQQGWILSEPARGTFVTDVLPEAGPRRSSRTAPEKRPVALELAPLEVPAERRTKTGTYPLLGGIPDLRLVPKAVLARAYRRAVLSASSTLGYGDARGDQRLIAALRGLLGTARGVIAEEQEIVITRGSQMGLHLVARALCLPGDGIAVEAMGYPPAWAAFRLAGAELWPVPIDAGGICLDRLEQLATRTRLRAVYVTPLHQYPTTVTLGAKRRLSLLEMAERHRFLIIEDDYDHEFHWSGRPVLPMASSDPARVVVYVGTLSKVLAPGLRIGYVVARSEIIERLLRLRSYIDRQGDQAVERAVSELIEDGELERHAKRARRAYLERRETLSRALQDELTEQVSFELPAGGLALWARVRVEMGVERWAELALARGVAIHTARSSSFDGRVREFVRFGFAALEPEEIRRAVRILAGLARKPQRT